jgi:hypothetical protein
VAVLRIEPLGDGGPRRGRPPLRRCDRCGRRRVLVARVLERRRAGTPPASVALLERDVCGECATAAHRREGEFVD